MKFFLNFLNNLFSSTKWTNILWYTIPLIAALIKVLNKSINNYLIYKNVYKHAIEKTNLYALYPLQHDDINYYGIIFGVLMAPFYYLPNWISILIYQALQLWGLNYVVRRLPLLSVRKQNVLLLYLMFEVIGTAQNVQINTFIAFVMVGAYVFIIKQKEFYSAFIIMLGFFVKLYGIVGLGLFFFVKNKMKYIFFLILSVAILFFLPLLITDLDFIKQSYIDWYIELIHKTHKNSMLNNTLSNISALGMVRKIFLIPEFVYVYIILFGIIMHALTYLKFNCFKEIRFQLLSLSALLLFIILFSNGTEASGHIIGATGVGIWWLSSKNYKNKNMIGFMIFVFLLGTLSITDLTPPIIRKFVRAYNLKALPYLIVWSICIYEALTYKIKTIITTKIKLQK